MSWYDDIRSLLAPDPNREYSALLPLSRAKDSNVVGGDQQFALPGAVREGLLGIVDLAHGTETGKLSGPALESLLGGMVGGGMTAPRGAIGSGPIRAYHGSPHSFEKFDPAKIGTGEGAQAYGHGLYFAGNEEVARSYKKAGPQGLKLVDDLNNQLSELANEMGKLSPSGYRQWTDPVRGEQLAAQYDALMTQRNKLGHMYEVDIHADPARFLDWDKRLEQQSPQVQQALQEGWFAHPSLNQSGARIYDAAAKDAAFAVGRGDFNYPGASDALRDAGIPGIRYLDQGSRSAGQGSSNYVVFPTRKEIIKILRKYGMAIPSPVAPPGAVPPSGLLDREGGA